MEPGCYATTRVETKIKLILPTLNQSCRIHGDAVAALLARQTIFGNFFHFSTACFFILVLAEAVHSIQAELLIGEAQVSNSRMGSSAARSRVDYGVADAAVLQPASLAAVQQLKFPCSIQLAHFSHHRAVSHASLGRLHVVHLLKTFQEIHFAWGGYRAKGKQRIFVVQKMWNRKGKQSMCIKGKREAPETSSALRVDPFFF